LVTGTSVSNSYVTTGNVTAGNVIATSIVIGTSTANSYTTTGNVNAGNIIATSITISVSTANSYTTAGNVTAGNVIATKIQGNTWVGLYTANVSESNSNLYYTNARVYSNVIALLPTLAGSGITIQANGQISAAVSGTVSLAGLTTSNLAEGTNLYYTNTRAVSAFTEGSGIAISSGGVISARGDSAGSGLFNSGIQLVGNTLAQSTFSNVKVFTFAEGNTFIGYSFHVTNITSNIVYLSGRHVFNSNTTLFANLLEMPVGASMEVFRKPQVFVANDIIQIQGFDQNRNALSNGISSYLSYQATVDDTYQRAGNTITGNALTTIYQTVGRVSIFESINLVNLSPNVIYGTVIVTDGSDNIVAYLAANLAIPAYASVDVCEYPKTLLDDYKIKVQKSDNYNPLSVFTSSKYTQSFAVTPSSNNMTESGTITLDLVTTNIVNGTVLYYAITGASGNINQTDFVTNTTGTVTVQNNAVRLTLQANADLNTNLEGDETFTVVYRKNSNVGTVVATSSSITLRDTSNVTVYTLTSNASSVLESTDVLFTLSTINLPPNTTYYWNTTGNATSSNFVTGNTGSFVSNANTSYNILLAANAMAAATSTDFQLRILTGSQTGTVVSTSNVITIVDASLAYLSATGGTIEDSGGYRIHAFTSTANLTISRIGASPALSTIEYLAVAGGGAGFNNTNNGYGGTGGGAGGLINSSFVATTTGNITVTIGAGGTGQNNVQNNGSNTTILGGGTTITAVGGGSGGWNNESGLPGGSGGGAAQSPTARTAASGYGYPSPTQQGYPGSTSGPGLFHGGGGGAGQAGQNGSSPTAGAGGNGAPISWAPPSYGTTGPAPGRWFAGGGGAGSLSGFGNPAGGAGGAGGGGAGEGQSGPVGFAGNVNTGGGGGGRKGPTPATAFGGGSGIVLIRYPYVDTINLLATGGSNVTIANGYKTHIFTSTANLNVTSLGVSGNIQVLVVAGGGSGGAAFQGGGGGGGGGAGGFRTSNLTLSSAGNILVTVGGGGAYNGTSPALYQDGGSGSPSIFSTITSTGGGGGGNRSQGVPGGSGGGWGGGGGGTPPVGLGNTPATSPPQGNPGGLPGPDDCSGGGGGSSTPGNPGGPAPAVGGAGGTGSPASGWDIPSSYGVAGPAPGRWFSGGGGAGGNSGNGAGGSGGGGQAAPVGSPAGTDGTPTTGGGGGGATGGNYPGTRAGSGGSGIVVVRYPYSL
jgi:hypothetical protein